MAKSRVWRWAFADRRGSQVLGGWGLWTTRARATTALRRAKRGLPGTIFRHFEVRRVPCDVRAPYNYPARVAEEGTTK